MRPSQAGVPPAAGEYVWADNELAPHRDINTPLYLAFGSDTAARFTPTASAQTGQFAKIAIEDQPMAYVRVVIDDTLHTFGWNRQPDPLDFYGNGPNFQFVSVHAMNLQIPWYATPYHIPGNPYSQQATVIQRASSNPTWCNVSCQKGDPQAIQVMAAERDFAGPGQGFGFTTEVQPWAHLLETYQRYIYLRGTLLGLIVLIGAAGLLARWRRWGGVGLLPWLVGALLIVLPPMTAGFSYRYVLAAAPVACLAAGLAFTRAPGGRSVRALAADLRRNLGRGGTVDQE